MIPAGSSQRRKMKQSQKWPIYKMIPKSIHPPEVPPRLEWNTAENLSHVPPAQGYFLRPMGTVQHIQSHPLDCFNVFRYKHSIKSANQKLWNSTKSEYLISVSFSDNPYILLCKNLNFTANHWISYDVLPYNTWDLITWIATYSTKSVKNLIS